VAVNWARRGGQVPQARRHGLIRHPVRLAQLDVARQLYHPAVQPVRVPSSHTGDLPGADVGQHPLVGGTATPAERRQVVVAVHLDNSPAQPLSERAALGFLAFDTEAGAAPILADTDVNRC